MRTLAFLAAILLLVLQAQAGPLADKAEEALEQQQPEEEELDMATSLEGAESSDPQNPDPSTYWKCKCKRRCSYKYIQKGPCMKDNPWFYKCCRLKYLWEETSVQA